MVVSRSNHLVENKEPNRKEVRGESDARPRIWTAEVLEQENAGLSSFSGTEVRNVREREESTGFHSHLDANMDWQQGLGRESKSLSRFEGQSQA